MLTMNVNNSEMRKLERQLTGMSDPRVLDRAMKAGYRKQLSKTARNLRRTVRAAGYRRMAKDVGSQLTKKKKIYIGRVGIRKKAKRYAALWHLLGLGVRSHEIGKRSHPGFTGSYFRERAARPPRQELDAVFWEAYNKTYAREIRKRL